MDKKLLRGILLVFILAIIVTIKSVSHEDMAEVLNVYPILDITKEPPTPTNGYIVKTIGSNDTVEFISTSHYTKGNIVNLKDFDCYIRVPNTKDKVEPYKSRK